MPIIRPKRRKTIVSLPTVGKSKVELWNYRGNGAKFWCVDPGACCRSSFALMGNVIHHDSPWQIPTPLGTNQNRTTGPIETPYPSMLHILDECLIRLPTIIHCHNEWNGAEYRLLPLFHRNVAKLTLLIDDEPIKSLSRPCWIPHLSSKTGMSLNYRHTL